MSYSTCYRIALGVALACVFSALALMLGAFFPSWANATQVAYTAEGSWGLNFENQSGGDSFFLAFHFDDLQLVVDSNSETLNVDGNFVGTVKSWDRQTNYGQATASIDLTYYDVHVGLDPNTGGEFDAIGRANSTSDGSAIISGDLTGLNGTSFWDVLVPFEAKFVDVTSNSSATTQAQYSELLDSGSFNFVMGFLSYYNADVFNTWLMSTQNVLINGEYYRITGDFHTTYSQNGPSEVPEPMSLMLLSAGLLGGVALRSKEQRV